MMWLQILHGTPDWVFVLFAGLLALGLTQMRTREVALGRVVGITLGMTLFSIYGTIGAFGWMPLASGLAGRRTERDGLACGAAGALRHPLRRDPKPFELPGSAVPLTLTMAIFFTKYGVAVTSAMQPGLNHDLRLALPACLLYGACSGAFAGRAPPLWWLVQASADAAVHGSVAL